MKLFRHGRLDLTPFLTHMLSLDNITEAYKVFGERRRGQGGDQAVISGRETLEDRDSLRGQISHRSARGFVAGLFATLAGPGSNAATVAGASRNTSRIFLARALGRYGFWTNATVESSIP
jgi:hypothetical protein